MAKRVRLKQEDASDVFDGAFVVRSGADFVGAPAAAGPASGQSPYFAGSTSKWIGMGAVTSGTALPNAAANLDVDNASEQLLLEATLSAARIYTAQAPAASRKGGFVFSVIRLDVTANAIQIKDGPSGNVMWPNGVDAEAAPPYKVDFFWDGANWSLGSYKPLSVQR